MILNIIIKNKDEKIKIIGPADASISRINDIFRKVIYLKHDSYVILTELKNKIEEKVKDCDQYKNLGLQFDFSPMNNY